MTVRFVATLALDGCVSLPLNNHVSIVKACEKLTVTYTVKLSS
jgi:hypothetical protein